MQMRVDIKMLEKAAFVMHVFVAIVLFAVVIHLNYPEFMTHAPPTMRLVELEQYGLSRSIWIGAVHPCVFILRSVFHVPAYGSHRRDLAGPPPIRFPCN